MTYWTIEPITIPASVDDADAADFIAAIELGNAVELEDLDTVDTSLSPAEFLPRYQRDWEPRELLVVRDAGVVVGALEYTWETDAPDTVSLWPSVAATHRGRGIGTALLEHAVDRARSEGRVALQSWTAQRPTSGGSRLESPTGSGSLDAGAASVRFAVKHGFTLGQVERISRLALPVALPDPPIDADYELAQWIGMTPPEHRNAIARLQMAIQRDAPSGDLDAGFTAWDAERVAENDTLRNKRDATLLTTLAVHRGTGDPAGYSELLAPADATRAVHQGDTVVIEEHRGHRLGMRLKIANLQLLARRAPGHPSVVTYNAEENRHMLSVNEDLGFVPIGYEGGWRRELA